MDLPSSSFPGECTATYDGGVVGISFLDHRITKLDASGTLLWSFVIDTSALQYLIGVIETEDHGIVAVGSHDNWNASLVWKLDENGNLLWQKRFNPTGQKLTVAWICPAHGDGGFLIGGGECAMEYYVIRCDANGDIQWQKQYFGLTSAPTGVILSLVQAPGSGYFGTFNRLETGDLDWGVLKIDDTGNLLWAKALDEGIERDEVVAAVATSAGGMAVVGTTTNYQAPNNKNKMTFTVFNGSGTILNYRVYDYAQQLQPHTITQTDDGGFVLAGSTAALETMVVKVDGLGGLQWQKIDAGSASQEAFGLANAGGGMFFMSAGDFTHKATLSKLSSLSGQGLCNEGALQLSTHTVSMIPITVASAAGTAVNTTISYPHYNTTTAATTICTSVANESEVFAQPLSASPNPFTSHLHVNLGAALEKDALLKLYDLQGKQVAQIAVPQGVTEIDWSLSNLAPGAYLLRADGSKEAIKLMHLGE
jgi:Secretion system C-terminal sorting domain